MFRRPGGGKTVSRPFRVGFCVSGGGKLFRAAVLHRAVLGIVPALLVTHEKAAADLDDFCAKNNVAHARLNSKDRPAFNARLAPLLTDGKLDLLALTFDKILPPEILTRGPRVVNVHMALLPAFKGLGGLSQALAAGAKVAGATLHEVTTEVDGGPIVAQCAVPVAALDTEETLGKKVFARLLPLYLQTLAWYAQGRVARDDRGRLWIKNADYSRPESSPAVEAVVKGLNL